MRRRVDVEDLVLVGGVGLAELLAGPGRPEPLWLQLYSPDEFTISWTLDALAPVWVSWKASPPLEGSTAYTTVAGALPVVE